MLVGRSLGLTRRHKHTKKQSQRKSSRTYISENSKRNLQYPSQRIRKSNQPALITDLTLFSHCAHVCGERKDVDQYLKGLFSVILCTMKDKPSSTVPTPASVVEFKDGTVQAQYRLDGQPIQSVSPSNRPSGLRQLLLSAFMPEGWPNAVTPDYTGLSTSLF